MRPYLILNREVKYEIIQDSIRPPLSFEMATCSMCDITYVPHESRKLLETQELPEIPATFLQCGCQQENKRGTDT